MSDFRRREFRHREDKRDLASRIVGSGEGWITELDDASLRELVSLSRDAAPMVDEDAAS